MVRRRTFTAWMALEAVRGDRAIQQAAVEREVRIRTK